LTEKLLPPPVAAQLLALVRPTIDLVSADVDADPASSRIGGNPLFPPQLRWPHRDGVPLSFLAQVRLEEVAPYDVEDALPPSGLLLFFYGGAEEAWGFDPDDRLSWRVLLVDPAGARVRAAPTGAEAFTERGLRPQPVLTLPDRWSEPMPALLAAEPAVADVLARFDADRPRLRHRLLGWAQDGHDSMQRVCRLAASGVYTGAGAAGAARADLRLGPAPDPTRDWRLLLQLDSDDGAGMVWGDECRLYFWVPPGPFDPTATWMVWRCG